MYQKMIRDELARKGYAGKYDARHIEAYMRLQYGTLDHLSKETFNREVEICRQCVDADPIAAERLAVSEGL